MDYALGTRAIIGRQNGQPLAGAVRVGRVGFFWWQFGENPSSGTHAALFTAKSIEKRLLTVLLFGVLPKTTLVARALGAGTVDVV